VVNTNIEPLTVIWLWPGARVVISGALALDLDPCRRIVGVVAHPDGADLAAVQLESSVEDVRVSTHVGWIRATAAGTTRR
jgi:hypothetical protein